MSMPATTERGEHAAWHQVLFYEDRRQYVDGVLRFVDTALDGGRPVFVAVPPANGELLRRHLDGRGEQVRLADMTRLGRNPSLIIPQIRGFIDEHPGRPVSFVGEPAWATRTPAEIAEVTRHEALINAAFDGSGAQVLCPYDIAGLAAPAVADAMRTHPELVDPAGRRQPSERYTDPRTVWADTGHLPSPPAGAEQITVARSDLGRLRSLARQIAAPLLAAAALDELLLAVTELATNSVRHGGGTATATIWATSDRVVCDVADNGSITDALAGRRRPDPDASTGRGLWLVNHLCDLVQLHSSRHGTRVRITVAPPLPAAPFSAGT
ncbi:MAG TPA: anti-sigma factor RsbA family regulatory protein [Nocardioidaceae bacterium]|nr:anti-sigma factor RsbA family regulatory protein [Nocardioidaceae bacterium]